MKKKIVLLPLLVLALTACDLNSLMNNNGGNNNQQNANEATSRAPIELNDAAIKIADMVSIFPEVGDELDLSEYISFDTGTDYKLEQFTFTSKNPDVISINNYHAICAKQGYAAVEVTGPGINTPVVVSFYVGSIAGNYVPDSKALDGVINLNIVQGNEGYSFTLDVVNKGKDYNKKPIISSSSRGTLIKNLTPFVPMMFDGEAPSSFAPITNYISELIPEAEEFQDLTQDMYGFMSADPDEGVLFKMRFNEKFITLAAE